MSRVTVMDHPLIQHKIGIIRRKEVGSKDFRQMISEIAMLMCYEASHPPCQARHAGSAQPPVSFL